MLADPYPVEPAGPFRLAITPPGSKSLTNRALVLAALAEGPSVLRNPLLADDTQVMVSALCALGVKVKPVFHGSGEMEGVHGWERVEVEGAGGRLPGGGDVDVRHAGTAARFLAAAATLAQQPVTIDGSERMRHRPIGELAMWLRQLGASVESLGEEGFLPLRIGAGSVEGGTLVAGPSRSSQFVSALLMTAAHWPNGLQLELLPPVTSPAYVAMTLALMERFQARFEVEGPLRKITVFPKGAKGTEYDVEPDATSATYFLAAAALVPNSVCTIEGLGKRSIQGDVAFADVLGQMGAGLTFGRDFLTVIGPAEGLRGIDVDMHAMPDAAMTLAVVAAFARGESVIRGLATLELKESPRLTALKTELEKLGATVEIEDDEVLVIEPIDRGDAPTEPVVIETYDDHRMAMAFAVAGLAHPAGVLISNPTCVGKTYPTFWQDFERIRAGENEPRP